MANITSCVGAGCGVKENNLDCKALNLNQLNYYYPYSYNYQ